MLVEIKVPALAESVSDATLLEWQKQPGEAISRGDNLIDLETDKVTLEVPAPESGVLKEICCQPGETVVTGDLLAIIDTEAQASQSTAPAAAENVSSETAPDAEAPAQPQATRVNPAARKLARERDVDTSTLVGSGPDGRVSRADVAQADSPAEVSPVAQAPAVDRPREDQRVPMTRLRKRAAERLLAAQQENAILTTFNEINMQPVMELRRRYKDRFEQTHQVRLGFLSFFARAVVEGLHRFPLLNASVDGDDIIYHKHYDIGIAVSSERGLVVPVVRDVDQLSFAGFEQRVAELSHKARSNSLELDDLMGGTFTITNGGTFGSLLSTPIINPPQSGILGMHKIEERPVAEEGEVVIRPMMYVALSYDHRIIDGADAVRFLVTVKDMLEDPARLLLEV